MAKGRHRSNRLPWKTVYLRQKRFIQNRWWWFIKPALKKRLANAIGTVLNGLAWLGSKLGRQPRK